MKLKSKAFQEACTEEIDGNELVVMKVLYFLAKLLTISIYRCLGDVNIRVLIDYIH